MQRCPLCLKFGPTITLLDKKRCYFHCPTCQAIFADNASILPPSVATQRYLGQYSKKKQQGLSEFVLALINQLNEHEHRPLIGLNFGREVDGETHSSIEAVGHKLYDYDPSLAPDLQTLRQSYDFVCSYHVVEHFSNPHQEWSLIQRLVKADGWLAISTRVLADVASFPKWHHKNNPTHVCFYQQATFSYLAKIFGFTLLFATDELILMKKKSKPDITRDQISTESVD